MFTDTMLLIAYAPCSLIMFDQDNELNAFATASLKITAETLGSAYFQFPCS